MGARKPQSISALRAMAKAYGVDKNALVQSALAQYAIQQAVILALEKELKEDDILTTKEYVKGRQNLYAHPALKELPRHTDSANRTGDLILKLITQLGEPPKEEGRLEALARE